MAERMIQVPESLIRDLAIQLRAVLSNTPPSVEDVPTDQYISVVRKHGKALIDALLSQPTPTAELANAEAVEALPMDSVVADADGFVFQVQDDGVAGVEGMGYGNARMSLRYPATLLRRAGGGALVRVTAEPPRIEDMAPGTTQFRSWVPEDDEDMTT